jgi:hypothetical protein
MMNLILPQDHGKPWSSMKRLAPAAVVQHPGEMRRGNRPGKNNENHPRHETTESFNRQSGTTQDYAERTPNRGDEAERGAGRGQNCNTKADNSEIVDLPQARGKPQRPMKKVCVEKPQSPLHRLLVMCSKDSLSARDRSRQLAAIA